MNVEYKSKNDKIIRPDLHDIIDNLKKSGEWKIQLTMKPKFMSSTDSNEKRKMYSKSDSVKVTIGNDTNKIIQTNFDLLLHNYQIYLKQSMRGSNFTFDYVSRTYYVCH